MILARLLAALLAANAAAEGGAPVTISGEPASLAVSVGPSAAGTVIWESAASDPLRGPTQGVLVQGRAPEGVVFEAALAGGAWTAATQYRADNGRFWGRVPLAAPKGAIVYLRAVSRGTPGGDTELFGAELIPPPAAKGKGRKAAPAPPPAPPGLAAKPAVRPREDWGAKDSLEPYEDLVPEKISIHHSEAAQPMSIKDAAAELRIIQDFHQRGRGWADIAYHFLIDGSGRVWEGRPEKALGAHVKDHNPGNVGICVMGDFQKRRPTKAQLASLTALLRWLTQAHAIAPGEIRGHKDQQVVTSCPGRNLHAQLPALRQAVVAPEKLSSLATAPLRVWSLSAQGAVSSLRLPAFDGRR